MMPLAPQLSVPHLGQISATPNIRSTMKASKPKLSFSIDSIVGKRKTFDSNEHDDSEQINETELLEKSIKRHFGETMLERCSPASPSSPGGSGSPEAAQQRRSVSPQSNGSLRATPNDALHRQSPEGGSPGRSLSPLSLVTHAASIHSSGQMSGLPGQFLTRGPMGVPTATGANHNSISPIPQATPGAGQMPLGHPSHQMMVAAAAAAASAHQFPSMPSEYQQAFYPWFLRANPFAGRFPGMPFDATLGSFLLPPFRKPKRIRTAFSPGQLLKLEQAFEKNHYVVGNERKQLANHLGLSETQVKVWFQNRRTKHKRQKQEDEESGSGSATNGESGSGTNKDFTDDEEEIDLEDDEDCNSDQEHDSGGASVMPPATNAATTAALKFANMHHLWYQSMGGPGGLVAPDHSRVSSSGST